MLRPSIRIASFLCCLGLVSAGLVQRALAQTDQPNIVLALADNWAWPHASRCGDRVVKTPNFDRVAEQGVLFNNAFCGVPSCAPARAVLLSGQASHRLQDGANLWGIYPLKNHTYTEHLQAAGYTVGYSGKGWGPGYIFASDWAAAHTRNPAGARHQDFSAFIDTVPDGKPFVFWFGSGDPHRPWKKGSQTDIGNMDASKVDVPPYLPDEPIVRQDILQYYGEIQKFDREVGQILDLLKKRGQLNNTLVIVTGDNGWQMPRGLANVYDSGTRVPLAAMWLARAKGGRTTDSFVNFDDFAPTFLQAAGLEIPNEMTGTSFLPFVLGQAAPQRDHVFLERERHANVRRGDRGYPVRAVRTRDHLYIRNLMPNLWPAGDPHLVFAVGPYGDVDPSDTKDLILKNRRRYARHYKLSFAKRPAEELYELKTDPHQIKNLARSKSHAPEKKRLRQMLDAWMTETDDPRASKPRTREFDNYRYLGPRTAH